MLVLKLLPPSLQPPTYPSVHLPRHSFIQPLPGWYLLFLIYFLLVSHMQNGPGGCVRAKATALLAITALPFLPEQLLALFLSSLFLL